MKDMNFVVEDYSRMLKITPENLPSCCYYTLLNGYLEINCLGKFNSITYIYLVIYFSFEKKSPKIQHCLLLVRRIQVFIFIH
jgi:hypothetical protein